MDREKFESLLFIDVEERAQAEPVPPSGEPKYSGRPWLQLRDEMVESGARTVAELPPPRITAFYEATQAGQGALIRFFQGLLGGASSTGAVHGGQRR